MPSTHNDTIRPFALVLLLSLLVGCAGPGSSGPVSPTIMLDREAHFGTRMVAARGIWDAVDRGEFTREEAREMLKRVIWIRRTSVDLRTLALDMIIEDEAGLEDTKNMMGYMLPTESRMGHLEILERIRDTAIEHQWRELRGPLVQSLSLELPRFPDNERPEYETLAGLRSDGDVVSAVFEVFVGPPSTFRKAEDEEGRIRDRMAAWALLRRLDPSGDQLIGLVRGHRVRTHKTQRRPHQAKPRTPAAHSPTKHGVYP